LIRVLLCPRWSLKKKLRCADPKLEPGGGGINVARVLTRLGGEAVAVFPSGGYTGKYFNHLLEKEGIPSVIIETSQETRENIIVLDESTNHQYRFGMPGTTLSDSEWSRCLRALEETGEIGFIVASGSLPPGVPADIYARIARIAKKKQAHFIADTSGEALKLAAAEGVYMLKPNLGELSTLAGKDKIDPLNVEATAREVLATTGCEILVISMGMDGALLVTRNETHRAIPPKVKKKSTVGAGDSMVAGIVYSLAKGAGLKEALAYGVACGTAATLNPGTELCHKEDADHLFDLMQL